MCYAYIIYMSTRYILGCRGLVYILVFMNIMFQLGTCRASLHMTYQYIANEVMKTFIVKNSTIIMARSKQFLVEYHWNLHQMVKDISKEYIYIYIYQSMYIKASLQFHHLCLCKDFKDTKKMDEAKIKYHIICSWWLSSRGATKECIGILPSGWNLALLL